MSTIEHPVEQDIPHRPPFLFVDAVDCDLDAGTASARWTPPSSWQIFEGHFPNHPIVPGVILVEAMAQAACVLGRRLGACAASSQVRLAGIDRARFRRPVRPGETVTLRVTLERSGHDLWRFLGHADVNGDRCAEAVILATLAEESA